MKLYIILHQDGTSTFSSQPIIENEVEGVPLEIDQTDLDSILEGTKEFEVKSGKVKLIPSNKKALRQEAELQEKAKQEASKFYKKELILKVIEGTATKDEVEKFAELL